MFTNLKKYISENLWYPEKGSGLISIEQEKNWSYCVKIQLCKALLLFFFKAHHGMQVKNNS